jgi:predicted GTPase
MRRVLILGAGGRDFHDFQVRLRDDPEVTVVAFTAAQIPNIDQRTFPTSIAGPRYPDGIPIRPESELEALLRDGVDEVVLSYSDLAHADVMHLASRVLAGGADFRLLDPHTTMLRSSKPVVAVVAVRTGCGKSPISRRVARIVRDRGLRPVLVRHPMPYGDLEAMRVQRFASLADIDAARPSVEEREEYEEPVRQGFVVFAGVDYAAILAAAEREADVIVWDGGNNDLPFFRPDVLLTVADPLRPGHELSSHPGEVNLRLADAVVVNKVDAARPDDVAVVLRDVESVNAAAPVVRTESPATLDDGPPIAGLRAVVVEDGPTITHGGMPFGAGYAAAVAAGAQVIDPRPWAAGSLAETFARFPHIGAVVPAMGYGDAQLDDLRATLRAAPCDVVVSGTPADLSRLLSIDVPIRRVSYDVREVGRPTLADALAPHLDAWAAAP